MESLYLASQSEQSKLDGDCNFYSGQEQFLNAIYKRFLEFVNPKEDGLVDELLAIGAISSDEEQEVDSKDTRRDKARQMWTILHHIPARMLGEQCVPVMELMYPHVVMGKTFDWTKETKLENRCLHHAIKKVLKLRRFADVLPESNCCSPSEYMKILNVEDGDKAWRRLFDILKHNSSNETLKKSVIKMLNNCGIVAPKQFDGLLESGFPCTCNCVHPHRKKRVLLDVPSKMLLRGLDEASSQTSYPFSGMSDHQSDADSELYMDQQMDEMHDHVQPKTDDAKPKMLESFDTQEDKSQYSSILDKIDKAITDASCIKPFFRALERIQDNILSSKSQARDEESDHLSEAQMQNLTRLRGKAVTYHSKIQRLYAAVDRVQKSVCDNQNLFCFNVPQHQNKVFLARKQILHNEIREASYFCNSSTKIMCEINLFCQNCYKHV